MSLKNTTKTIVITAAMALTTIPATASQYDATYAAAYAAHQHLTREMLTDMLCDGYAAQILNNPEVSKATIAAMPKA